MPYACTPAGWRRRRAAPRRTRRARRRPSWAAAEALQLPPRRRAHRQRRTGDCRKSIAQLEASWIFRSRRKLLNLCSAHIYANWLTSICKGKASMHSTLHFRPVMTLQSVLWFLTNQTHRNSMRGGGASASSCTALGFRAVSRPMCSRSSAAHAQCNTGWACPASAVTCSTCLRLQNAHLYIFSR